MPDTLGSARHALAAKLAAAGVVNDEGEARALVAAATGLDAAGQAAAPERALSAEEVARLEDFARRRMAGEPLQHITGHADFWTFRLRADARALIPRPDTESVVEAALGHLPADRPVRVLDLGAGSGALLLAILGERPLAVGVGVDSSAGAIELSRENAALTGLSDRAAFVLGGWDSVPGPFDLVVSNPPYIRTADLADLSREVRRDPREALDGGADGLDAYRAILPLLPALLAPGGVAVFEIGWDQAASVAALAERTPGLAYEGLRHDLEERDRAVIFRFAGDQHKR